MASELAVAEANILAALEQRAADTLETERISAMIERRMMRSPFNGVVTRVYHEEKEFVGNNNSPVLTIMQLDKLRVTFTVPTAQIARLKVGSKRSAHVSQQRPEGHRKDRVHLAGVGGGKRYGPRESAHRQRRRESIVAASVARSTWRRFNSE